MIRDYFAKDGRLGRHLTTSRLTGAQANVYSVFSLLFDAKKSKRTGSRRGASELKCLDFSMPGMWFICQNRRHVLPLLREVP